MATSSYGHLLVRHGWTLVPTHSPIYFYAHELCRLDRIQVFNGVWSHAHFDGQSWLVTAHTRGNDPASLAAYLTKHFRHHHFTSEKWTHSPRRTPGWRRSNGHEGR